MSDLQLILLGSASDFLPLLAGLLFVRKLDASLKLFLLYFILAFFMNLRVLYLEKHGLPNLVEFNGFLLVEYALFLAVLSSWARGGSVRKVLRSSIVVFLTSWFVLKFSGWTLLDLFFYFRTAQSVILVLVATYLLYYLSLESEAAVTSMYQFWICVGIIIYFSGSVLYYAAVTKLGVPGSVVIHTALNVIANLFYAGGFVCQRRQPLTT